MESQFDLEGLRAEIASLRPVRAVGRVTQVSGGVIHVCGLTDHARIGDGVRLLRHRAAPIEGEVIQLEGGSLVMLPERPPLGVAMNDRVVLLDPLDIAPSDHWIGRVIDPNGRALDGRPILRGGRSRPLLAPPPPPAQRRGLGPRLSTGMTVLNTMLPVVEGQRVGLFAGSGVGKSSLLGHLAQNMQSDVVVIALVGERGRELRHFLEEVLGPEGLARAVVVAATSDQSPLMRRRCALTAMAVAEHFRDAGRSVLLLADSITRFAEAHREVAVAAGEAPVLRGYPPSTAHQIMSLCERAGTGGGSAGNITAVFSVLVAGSDMEEPIADIMRGVLDGHIILDREIAERGRFPAIDLLRSVSRSLPAAASEAENKLIGQARRLLGAYERNSVMIRAGLYAHGSDTEVDQAIALWPELDAFVGKVETQGIKESFSKLGVLLRRTKPVSQSRSRTGHSDVA